MHILLIHQAFAALDQPGGTRHHELSRYLAARGHQVTIIASPVSYLTGNIEVDQQKIYQFEGGGNLSILRAYTYPALHHSFLHRIFSFFSFMLSSFFLGLRVRHVDLMWGTSPPIFQGVTAWLLSMLKSAPFLFEVRDLWPSFAVQVGVLKQPLLIRASELLEGFLYRQANTVVVNSPGFIEHVKERGASRVELVPNGTDTRLINPGIDGNNFRSDHGLAGKFVVLYAGAHGMSNDLGIVLKAAKILESRQDISFVLLGDGKEKPSLLSTALELDLKNLLFIPPVPKMLMPQALAAADACIAILKPIPLYSTVYPNKVFDYMAAGKPVLLAIDGVIRQVVETAQAGVFVPPGDPQALADAVQMMADNPHQTLSFGANARRCMEEKFDRAKIAAGLEDTLRQIAEG